MGENLQGEGKDEGSRNLRNVGILPQHYTASQPRRPQLEFLSKLMNLCVINDDGPQLSIKEVVPVLN
jgi:hypothetical protein